MNTKKPEESCCVVSCENPLDEKYWNDQYEANSTGWDLGSVSPPMATYIDTLRDKNIKILIPGCGNAYEAEYLLQNGFTNVTLIDIAPLAVANQKKKFEGKSGITILQGDFFLHEQQYDLILEQTFFCALPPSFRRKYVAKMHALLNDRGVLAGLLFNRTFEKSPPFGGSKEEYEDLFSAAFTFRTLEICKNSITPRANNELWFEFAKNPDVKVKLYRFEGITCSGCMNTVKSLIEKLPEVLHVTISLDFTEALISSAGSLSLQQLNESLGTNSPYKIIEAN